MPRTYAAEKLRPVSITTSSHQTFNARPVWGGWDWDRDSYFRFLFVPFAKQKGFLLILMDLASTHFHISLLPALRSGSWRKHLSSASLCVRAVRGPVREEDRAVEGETRASPGTRMRPPGSLRTRKPGAEAVCVQYMHLPFSSSHSKVCT